MKIFTTAPPSVRFQPRAYLDKIAQIARWHEDAGIEGMLIYTDNSLIDPWTVAQAAIERTSRFVPLIATQPVYMHPLAAARKISSLGFLYGRRVALNMVAGGFSRDLAQLGDKTEHDRRYDRLIEYSTILLSLLRGETITLEGLYYQVERLQLQPAGDPVLMPDLYLSGASEACKTAAASLGATRLSYTKPLDQLAPVQGQSGPVGLRLGVIARPDRDSAWEVARARFPADRRGQLAHRMARGSSDSIWHRDISEVAETLDEGGAGPYWLFPLKNYKTFCPYLVGSYGEVAEYIRGYARLGFETLILDEPTDHADLAHTMQALDLSGELVRR
ncbi:MAG: LLM class flavin-dependent oxidoreductase [Paenirhodobacter sp.]|uniref:LLM class flavin-dependent oxidoreductase n=1 Tax=Paenirhodobacter sp. TaxID=1965326 RepID=UPI003D13F77B